MLLDHIPQDEKHFSPTTDKPHIVRFDVTLPDIDCQDCALIMYNPMVNGGATCSRTSSTCSAYHSCANIRISGRQNLTLWAQSYSYSVPNWPFVATTGVYTQESAKYNGTFPAGYPEQKLIGPCAKFAQDGKSDKDRDKHPEGRDWPGYIWSLLVMFVTLLSR